MKLVFRYMGRQFSGVWEDSLQIKDIVFRYIGIQTLKIYWIHISQIILDDSLQIKTIEISQIFGRQFSDV